MLVYIFVEKQDCDRVHGLISTHFARHECAKYFQGAVNVHSARWFLSSGTRQEGSILPRLPGFMRNRTKKLVSWSYNKEMKGIGYGNASFYGFIQY